MNKQENSPNRITPGAVRGLFYSLSKHNRYLATVLQRIDQAVIVVDGYAVDHGVPQLFVEFDGRNFKLGELAKQTTWQALLRQFLRPHR